MTDNIYILYREIVKKLYKIQLHTPSRKKHIIEGKNGKKNGFVNYNYCNQPINLIKIIKNTSPLFYLRSPSLSINLPLQILLNANGF